MGGGVHQKASVSWSGFGVLLDGVYFWEGKLMEKEYLIYSEKWSTASDRAIFWRPEGKGYTSSVSEAGLFTKEEAEANCGPLQYRTSHPVKASEVLAVCHLVAPREQVRNLIQEERPK
jgi:hypothetical protein